MQENNTMRTILGLFLALSFCHACEQPYEEVNGYKIGCPFNHDQKQFKLIKPDNGDGLEIYANNPQWIDNHKEPNIHLMVMNNTLEGVKFWIVGNAPDVDQKRLNELDQKWGKHSHEKVDTKGTGAAYRFKHIYTWRPDNKNIHKIIFKSDWYGIAYYSKSLSDVVDQYYSHVDF